jgi:hypothetical protein
MPVDLTIRDVPDEVRDALVACAERAGLSLEEYLRRELIALAPRPPSAEFWEEVRARKAVAGTRLSAADILAARDAGRR